MTTRLKIAAACAAALVASLLFALRPALRAPAPNNMPPAPNDNRADIKAVVTPAAGADNALGFKLLNELRREKPGTNVFISPLSIGMALHMTWNGAGGDTATEMAKALQLGDARRDAINIDNQALLAILRGDDTFSLDIANSIWMRQGEDISPTFITCLKEYYGAEPRTADFADPATVTAINKWCADNTRDKIQKAIERIGGDVVMYLINAVYFKGRWQYQFKKEDTRDGDFHTAPGASIEVPLMSQTIDVLGLMGKDFMAGKLTYEGGRISMVIFVPDEADGLADLCARMTPEQWERWLKQFSLQRHARVVLPRFKIEYGARLVKPLQALGMELAFIDGAADFGGMRSDGRRDLHISDVIHKTLVEVNEEGTEAAAVTVVEARTTSNQREFSLVADKPFLYAICDETTGAIIFLGVMHDPTAK